METENYSPQAFVTIDEKYRAPNEEIFLLRKRFCVDFKSLMLKGKPYSIQLRKFQLLPQTKKE
jgi:hypothetical protein